MEEPKFPSNEFPILDDGGTEEQAHQEQFFVDLPQNQQPDNQEEITPENADLFNQITVQG